MKLNELVGAGAAAGLSAAAGWPKVKGDLLAPAVSRAGVAAGVKLNVDLAGSADLVAN